MDGHSRGINGDKFEAVLGKYEERAEFETTDNTLIMSLYSS